MKVVDKLKNKRKNKELKVKENGITLIALVITVIVLLILAAVSIATLTGQNGILSRANEARTETEEAEEDELRRLTALEAATNLSNEDYYDVNEDKAVIPAGFAVSKVEGENVIDDGLVIIDANGNEFVWVPVSQENFDTEFVRRAGYYNEELQGMTNYGEANIDGNNVTINGTSTELVESDTTIEEAKQVYKSVHDNGGFYIGRYEAGKDTNGNVVVKKAVNVYNDVTWSKNKTMNEEGVVDGTEGNPDGAIELARNFDQANGYTTVTSTLCYGVQWDVTLTWIDPTYTGFAKDSTGKGYYNASSPTTTGSNSDYEVNKIYDLAGNVYEWTMESHDIDSRVYRGGRYNHEGSSNPASNRIVFYPSGSSSYLGFRITLYLKS